MRDLETCAAGVFVCGVEPVGAFDPASSKKRKYREWPHGSSHPAKHYPLAPEFATLHRAANPTAVVKERLRVARAVFLCRASDKVRCSPGC